MDRMIPELKGQEKNTLYVIGNGFDRYHGLKTSYHDFHTWLISHSRNDFVLDMEKMFPTLSGKDHLLWKDFEEAIGKFNLLNIHRKFFQGNDEGFYDEVISKRAVERIRPTLYDIPKFLRQWLEDLDLDKAINRLHLDSNSLYFSFNYTQLLECFYSIPNKRVLHIHNSLRGDDILITGHKTQVAEDEAEKQCRGANEEKSTQLIAQEMNKLRKPVHQQIEQHQDFFKTLRGVSNVVVFGHSLSIIDRPYITEIQMNIKKFSNWYFISKDDEGVSKMKDYVRQYNDQKRYNISNDVITESELYKQKMMNENCRYIKTDK